MARKPAHFSAYSTEEVDLRFEEAVKSLGQAVNHRGAAVNDVVVDGVRFGDSRKEFRKPGSLFYSQSYLEALSVAGLCVDLEIAPNVADVCRRKPPLPDIEVRLRDGGSIFVEQTDGYGPRGSPFHVND